SNFARGWHISGTLTEPQLLSERPAPRAFPVGPASGGRRGGMTAAALGKEEPYVHRGCTGSHLGRQYAGAALAGRAQFTPSAAAVLERRSLEGNGCGRGGASRHRAALLGGRPQRSGAGSG